MPKTAFILKVLNVKYQRIYRVVASGKVEYEKCHTFVRTPIELEYEMHVYYWSVSIMVKCMCMLCVCGVWGEDIVAS